MRIIINPNLKPADPESLARLKQYPSLFDKLIGDQTKNGASQMVESGITSTHVTHGSYMEYLSFCWAHHWEAVLTPDIFRHIILSQVGQLVTRHAEVFRALFTDSNEKKDIILQGAPPHYPLEGIY